MNTHVHNKIQKVARGLGFTTLETRGSDDRDMQVVAVWQIKQALLEMYYAGFADGAVVDGNLEIEGGLAEGLLHESFPGRGYIIRLDWITLKNPVRGRPKFLGKNGQGTNDLSQVKVFKKYEHALDAAADQVDEYIDNGAHKFKLQNCIESV